LSSITTYSISGCTNLNVLVVDLGPGLIVPGDVNYYTFTGATPSGCYTVISKINAPIDDAFTASFGTGGCDICESTYITPTPTPTNTETPTPTPTTTPTNTETPTPTPTITDTPTSTPTPTPTSGYTISGWVFNSPDNEPAIVPPSNNGDTVFIYDTIVTYNPNYTGGTLELYFNNNTTNGTSYLTQFTELGTSGGTITISQGSSVAIYSGTSGQYSIGATFSNLFVTSPSQMIQSASTPFVSGVTINLVKN
jgi:hypothetical protein